MMTTRSTVWWAGVFALVLAGQAQARTQQENQVADAAQLLAPVLVQGERLQTELPVGATITTRQQLDERSIASWEDFSKRGEPGVSFSRHTNSISIRGMDSDRVVTRMDGIRLPWLTDGARGEKGGLNAIDFNALSSIDLVRSAGANRSGSLVGYLDVRTLSPDDLLEEGKAFGALVKSGYDSADESWGADAALAGRLGAGDTSWLLQAGHRRGHELENRGDIGGYGAKREKANPEDFKQQNLMLKLQHKWNDEHKLSLSGESFKRTTTLDNQREQGAGTSYLLGQNSTDKELSRERIALGYDFQSSQSKAPVEQGSVKLYWQRSRLEGDQHSIRSVDGRAFIIPGDPFRYGYPSGPYGRGNSVQESGLGLTSQWTGNIDGGAVQQRWSVGADWYGSRTEQNSSGYDNCPVVRPGLPAQFGPRSCDFLHTNQSDMPRVKGQQWAVWAQDEVSWADGKYALTPALRFDSYKQTPQAASSYTSNPNAVVNEFSSSSGQRASPSLLAAYKPQDNLTLYARYGYGFKAPNAAQLYLNYGAPGTYLRAGNPTLKAEISRGWELGVEAGDADLGARLSLFENRYRNFIDDVGIAPGSSQWDPAWSVYPMGVTQSINRANVRIYGAELSAHAALTQHWYTWGAVAWSQGRDQGTDQYLNSVAPLKAVVGLGYRADQWGAEGILTLAKRRSKVQYPQATPGAANPDFQAPGYGVFDLTAYWKPPAAKGLRLQAGLYNVLDKKYWNALDVPTAGVSVIPNPINSYTQPGRSARISLTYKY